MSREHFTREDVVSTARMRYGRPVCVDLIEDALECETLEEAVDLILFDSQYWDGTGFFAGRDE